MEQDLGEDQELGARFEMPVKIQWRLYWVVKYKNPEFGTETRLEINIGFYQHVNGV